MDVEKWVLPGKRCILRPAEEEKMWREIVTRKGMTKEGCSAKVSGYIS